MSETLLFVVGCTVFAITTMAALWAGYILFQRAWVNENPELTTDADKVPPLFNSDSSEQQGPLARQAVRISPSSLDR